MESEELPSDDLGPLAEMVDALEDEPDLPVMEKRLREFEETGEGIPWEQIKAERGL